MKLVSMLAPVLLALAAASLPGAALPTTSSSSRRPSRHPEQYRRDALPEDVVRMYLARIAAYDQSSLGQPLAGGLGQQP